MFGAFARARWVGRVLNGAGIDARSKTWMELSNILSMFSKHCQEKNRRGDGAGPARPDLGPAEWVLIASICASGESRVTDHAAKALGLSQPEVAALLDRIRESAIRLADRERPGLQASVTPPVHPTV